MKLYALFIWINDDPITGSVLSLTNIIEPRKELSDYKIGELVTVRFSKFGTPKGIIGKIGDESKKKELKEIIDDHKSFMNVLEQTCPDWRSTRKENGKQNEGTTTVADQTDNDLHVPVAKETPKPPKENGRKEKVSSQFVQEEKGTKKKAVTEKQAKINLEKAAEAQRMFEMNTMTQSSTEASSQFVQEEKGTKKKAVTEKQPKINLEKAAEAQTMFEMNTMTQSSTDSNESNCTVRASVSSAFRVINGEDSQTLPSSSSTNHIQHLEGKVHWLEMQLSQAWSCIYELQRNVQWLSQNQSFHGQHHINNDAQQSFQSVSVNQNAVPTIENVEAVKDTSQQQLQTVAVERNNEELFNNYTKEQLYNYIKHSDDYAKASKLLFRKLYSVEEYRGRSLTGNRANSKTEARPALEDTRKLQVIHELIQRRWAYAKPSMINVKLSEVLKPSRN